MAKTDEEWGGVSANKIIRIMFKEIAAERGDAHSHLPIMRESIADSPEENEQAILAYLENAPNYSAMGKVVRDALDPLCGTVLFPGTNTDGLYLWPIELVHYVRKYHVRLPRDFIEHMASLNWTPPSKSEVDFKQLHLKLRS